MAQASELTSNSLCLFMSSPFHGVDENHCKTYLLRASTLLSHLFLSLPLTGMSKLHSREFSFIAEGRSEMVMIILERNSKILSQIIYFYIPDTQYMPEKFLHMSIQKQTCKDVLHGIILGPRELEAT